MSEERFWNNVSTIETEKGCLEWKLSCNTVNGYGSVRFRGKTNGAHRLAFELFHKRPITEGMCILHICDNPKCCRPSHLREGTQQENMAEKILRNRQPRGEACSNSKLTEVQVLEIRAKYEKGTYSCVQLGTEYTVSRKLISNIIRRERWAHI